MSEIALAFIIAGSALAALTIVFFMSALRLSAPAGAAGDHVCYVCGRRWVMAYACCVCHEFVFVCARHLYRVEPDATRCAKHRTETATSRAIPG